MQPGTSLLELLLKSCTINSSQDLSHQRFITIKVLSLNTSCFITWKSYVILSTQELHPVTQKETVKSNILIELSCQCSGHFPNHASPFGKNISTKLFMLTTVLGMNRLAIHHSLIFGCYPCLPIELVFNLKPPVENKSYPKYVADWQSAMKEVYSIAASKCKAQGDKAKAFYDLKVRASTLLPGDHVLIKNLSECGGPGKLQSYWEDKLHVVVHRKSPASPVYQLKPENGTGPIRTLHRNLLFPCGSPLESSSTPLQASPGQQELKPSTTLSKRKSQRSSK